MIAVTSANRTILGSIFTAIFVAILNNKLPGEFQKHLVPQVIEAGLPESSVSSLLQAVAAGASEAIAAVPGVNSELLAVVNAGAADSFAGAYAYVYYTALALALAAAIAAMFIRDMDHYLTDHVSRQIYHKKETRHDVLLKD
ncbi:uncharacterized protein N0V89_001681 [Didymosphaeria variabile]|uniref:Uncharacterized protein n=1 Tax=Didymosphaeria variabile TaxID=1932322 RepID=A0A9W9CGY4_9PLEO|nr:uncharacterized protein N0V89_001681 [Didymosphaeria variabile]KAJ4361112.1 hypothetical protein N0V89_001681 [Didymosphaeria variabile]